METEYKVFADELVRSFAAMSEMIECQVLAEMLSDGDTLCSFRFEIDTLTYVAQFQKSFRDFPAFPAGDLRKTRGFA